jgi:N-methylhydantoinase B/oxoprolinase/acetone carboxylase alpha subunit
VKENLVNSHVTELRGQADLGAKSKSVQSMRREVTRVSEQIGENPVFKHVQELHQQAEPVYSQERIDEVRKRLPDLTTQQILRRLKREDERKEDERRGRRRGFSFF